MERMTMQEVGEPTEQTDVGAVEQAAGEALSLAERAEQARQADLACDRAIATERARAEGAELAADVARTFRVLVDVDRRDLLVDGTSVTPVVRVDGLAFVHDEGELHLLDSCVYCGHVVRRYLGMKPSLATLGNLLREPAKCASPGWTNCPGPERPFTREEAAYARAQARLAVASDELGKARAYEQQLEDERPLIKEQAILRLMQITDPATAGTEKPKPYSATKAEAFVEHDEMYLFHRKRQREAVVATQRAWGDWESAKLAAQLAAAKAGAA